jgi:hypothetical protein
MLKHEVNNKTYKLLPTDDKHYTLSKNDVFLLNIRGNKDNEPVLEDIDKYIDAKITKYEKTHSHQILEEIKEVQSALQSFQGDLINEHEHKESILGKFIETFLRKVNQRYEKAFDSVRDDKYNISFKPDEGVNNVSIGQSVTLPKVNQGVIKVAYDEVETNLFTPTTLTPTTPREENRKPEVEPINRARNNESFIISDQMSSGEKKKNENVKFQLKSDVMQNQYPSTKLSNNSFKQPNKPLQRVEGLNTSKPQVSR